MSCRSWPMSVRTHHSHSATSTLPNPLVRLSPRPSRSPMASSYWPCRHRGVPWCSYRSTPWTSRPYPYRSLARHVRSSWTRRSASEGSSGHRHPTYPIPRTTSEVVNWTHRDGPIVAMHICITYLQVLVQPLASFLQTVSTLTHQERDVRLPRKFRQTVSEPCPQTFIQLLELWIPFTMMKSNLFVTVQVFVLRVVILIM